MKVDYLSSPAISALKLRLYKSVVLPSAIYAGENWSFMKTRSSADADNGLDAFVGQSRSTNISGPFQVK